MLSFENVGLRYGDAPETLQDVTFDVAPRSFQFLTGPSGAGKSTMASLLARLYDVNGGAVRIDGHDVRHLTQASLRANVGVVLDEPFLFSVSVRDNIAYGAEDPTDEDIDRAARAARVDHFVRTLPDGYETLLTEGGGNISAGERQLLTIARAFLADPAILILDEATEGLAPLIRAEIWRCLDALKGEGQAILVIDKNVDAITALADRHVVIEKGRVVWTGSSDALRAAPDVQHRYLGV